MAESFARRYKQLIDNGAICISYTNEYKQEIQELLTLGFDIICLTEIGKTVPYLFAVCRQLEGGDTILVTEYICYPTSRLSAQTINTRFVREVMSRYELSKCVMMYNSDIYRISMGLLDQQQQLIRLDDNHRYINIEYTIER
jgi:hypothetical protein